VDKWFKPLYRLDLTCQYNTKTAFYKKAAFWGSRLRLGRASRAPLPGKEQIRNGGRGPGLPRSGGTRACVRTE